MKISNLTVSVHGQVIIRNLSCTIPTGTTVGLMGPNGSGKSTLAYAIAGHPKYVIEQGAIEVGSQQIHTLGPDLRAKAGIMLAFQSPPEIPGVSLRTFFHEIYRAIHGNHPWITVERRMMKSLGAVGLAESFAERSLNEGFSGGEKKRLEAAQLLFLKPKYAILDELDAGLDLNALGWLKSLLEQCRHETPEFSALIISHNPAVMQELQPTEVHVMQAGTIISSGNQTLITRLKEQGYHAR